jgi:uncharacterized membrane protein
MRSSFACAVTATLVMLVLQVLKYKYLPVHVRGWSGSLINEWGLTGIAVLCYVLQT